MRMIEMTQANTPQLEQRRFPPPTPNDTLESPIVNDREIAFSVYAPNAHEVALRGGCSQRHVSAVAVADQHGTTASEQGDQVGDLVGHAERPRVRY
mgnify:CR=1 FL=1